MDVEIRRFSTPMALESVDHYIAHLKDSSRVLLALIAEADEETCTAIWKETADAAARFVTWDGFRGPGEILIAAAGRP